MDQETTPPPASRLSLVLAALAIAVGIVAAAAATLTIAAGHRLDPADQWPGFLAQVAMVAAPFLLLALLNVRARRPWLIGVALTVAIWGFHLFDALRNLEGGDHGVNINLALAMFASPIVITLVCLVAALVGRSGPAGASPPPRA